MRLQNALCSAELTQLDSMQGDTLSFILWNFCRVFSCPHDLGMASRKAFSRQHAALESRQSLCKIEAETFNHANNALDSCCMLSFKPTSAARSSIGYMQACLKLRDLTSLKTMLTLHIHCPASYTDCTLQPTYDRYVP